MNEVHGTQSQGLTQDSALTPSPIKWTLEYCLLRTFPKPGCVKATWILLLANWWGGGHAPSSQCPLSWFPWPTEGLLPSYKRSYNPVSNSETGRSWSSDYHTKVFFSLLAKKISWFLSWNRGVCNKECHWLTQPQVGCREMNTPLTLEYHLIHYWNCDFKVSKILQYAKCSHTSQPTITLGGAWDEHRSPVSLNMGKLRLTEQSDQGKAGWWPTPTHQPDGRLLGSRVGEGGKLVHFVVEQKHC